MNPPLYFSYDDKLSLFLLITFEQRISLFKKVIYMFHTTLLSILLIGNVEEWLIIS